MAGDYELSVDDALLVQELHYNPVTGIIVWAVSKKGRKAGTKAGRAGSQGYAEIRTRGRILRSHRVAFFLTHHRWPEGVIDHINGDVLDNRWSNLRECTQAENSRNQKLASDNPYGMKGITQFKNKWHASICYAGKNHFLGVFETAEQAHQAYQDASEKFHGSFARVA